MNIRIIMDSLSNITSSIIFIINEHYTISFITDDIISKNLSNSI